MFRPVGSPDSTWGPVPVGPAPFRLHMERGGRYDLYLRYSFQPETVTHYTMVIWPYWWNTLLFRIGIGLLLLVLAAAIAFLVYRRKKLNQFDRQEEQRQKAILSLQSIQAQLNPHFIFNSLTSIQGLINSGNIDGANQYLSEFSVLMRNTLAEHERILHRLGSELKSMETYLRLEQLRFHFQYRFYIDPGLRVDEGEIPRLLLQPVIENAVRHGVSGLRENGIISIFVTREGDDLKIGIQDNGPGMPANKPANKDGKGYGLNLTHDRIRLLNQMQGEVPIELTGPEGPGTTFTFIFKNWL